MKKIVSVVMFLFFIKQGFTFTSYSDFEAGLESINLEGEAQNWFETFGTNTLVHLYLESSTVSIADVKADVFSWGGSKIYEAFLRDDGSRGDITAGDEEWGCMFGGGLSKNDLALFEVSFGPDKSPSVFWDSFLGNNLSFDGRVQVKNDGTFTPSLEWNSIDNANSYWVGIWSIDKNFEGEFGYIDLSGRVAEYEVVDEDGNSGKITVKLEDLPVGEYKFIVWAKGAGENGTDGGVFYGNKVTVAPEPVGSLLSLVGFFPLFGVRKFRRKFFDFCRKQ